MGTKYEGSVKQVVDGILKSYAENEEDFTVDEIRKSHSMAFKPIVPTYTAVRSIIGRYVALGVVKPKLTGGFASKPLLRDRYMIYEVVKSEMIGLTATAIKYEMEHKKEKKRIVKSCPNHSEVKRIEPVDSILEKDFTFEQIGEAVFNLIKNQASHIRQLQDKMNDIRSGFESDRSSYREIIRGKDKTIEELKAQNEKLKGHVGKSTFKLAEVAQIR